MTTRLDTTDLEHLQQWFSIFFSWRHIFHKIIFGDTQEKIRDTQICRDTLFENR
jgi:hypothetical protein